MRRAGLVGRHRPRKIRTAIPADDAFVIPDLVEQRFEPRVADRAWCPDITYVPTGKGWLFVAGVLDLGSRRCLGYSMADHMRTELVLDALNMAVTARGGNAAGVIAHADRGAQYTSNDYIDFCLANQLRPSCGRVATCYDCEDPSVVIVSLRGSLPSLLRVA